MSDTAIQTTATFEERMINYVKDSMGSLMTDDELNTVIYKATQKIFFEATYEKDRYGSKYIQGPPLAQKMVAEVLNGHVKTTIEAWFRDNPEKVLAVIQRVMDESLIKAMTGALMRQTNAAFLDLKTELENVIYKNELKV